MTRPASSRRGGSSEGSSIPVVFYFDLGSPYAYLASERIGRQFPEPPLWQPILLGGLFKRLSTGSWALGDARATNVAEIERRARAYGLPPVVWPKPFPGNTLFAMRAATHALEAGAVEAFALTAFREAFASGRDLSLPDSVLRVAAVCGLAVQDVRAAVESPDDVLRVAAGCGLAPGDVRAAVESPAVKDALHAATEHAGDLGVRGVPSLLVGSTIYFGDDRLDAAAAAKRHGRERS